eukprot:CAMPEP_0204308284 /NCGR_PEP_ID=MMETSP0469-20131031/416_1 /ASSEMBLY_ACC=CAM_ASM_000384 /TAXON_ID=2969 /ORGANISM="Oxyrrhis marina" /LENGTH=768 /DNA_ID=CAMNT_0051287741 /DNA_START=33 /DNA_END=2339 /DNA_ORIENTATION=-
MVWSLMKNVRQLSDPDVLQQVALRGMSMSCEGAPGLEWVKIQSEVRDFVYEMEKMVQSGYSTALPTYVVMVELATQLRQIGQNAEISAVLRMVCPVGAVSLQIASLMLVYGVSQRLVELQDRRSFHTVLLHGTFAQVLGLHGFMGPDWAEFEQSVRWTDILHSRWRFFGVLLQVLTTVTMDLRVAHELKDHPDPDVKDAFERTLYRRNEVSTEMFGVKMLKPCESDPKQEEFKQLLLYILRASRTISLSSALLFLFSTVHLDGLFVEHASMYARLDFTSNQEVLRFLTDSDPLTECSVGLSGGLIALATGLRCMAGRHSRVKRVMMTLLDAAQRHLQNWEAVQQDPLQALLHNWPVYDMLADLEGGFPHSPDDSTAVLVSFSDHEHHGWAKRFAMEVFANRTDWIAGDSEPRKVVWEVKANVNCADVYVFRAISPFNFGGVAVFVDGENGLSPEIAGEYHHMLRAYPKLLYLGTRAESRVIQDTENQWPGTASESNSVWLPYVSTSFAQRNSTVDELLRLRSHPGSRPGLVAYMAYNCKHHREAFFREMVLAREKRERAMVDTSPGGSITILGPVLPLSACRGQGGEHGQFGGEAGAEAVAEALANADGSISVSRYETASFMDSATEAFRSFKFAMAFENTDTKGYITEKIMNVFLAGAVPIYWGTEDVKEVFNPESFVFAGDFQDFSALAEYVIDLSLDKRRYEEIATAPILNPGSFDRFFSWQRTPDVDDGWLARSIRHTAYELHTAADGMHLGNIWSDIWDVIHH